MHMDMKFLRDRALLRGKLRQKRLKSVNMSNCKMSRSFFCDNFYLFAIYFSNNYTSNEIFAFLNLHLTKKALMICMNVE